MSTDPQPNTRSTRRHRVVSRSALERNLRAATGSFPALSRLIGPHTLFPYQIEAGEAIDEAQDVDEQTYLKSFRPMTTTTGATTVLFGTAWDGDNIIEQQRLVNERLESETGRRLNFIAPWTVRAAVDPVYRDSVTAEIG